MVKQVDKDLLEYINSEDFLRSPSNKILYYMRLGANPNICNQHDTPLLHMLLNKAIERIPQKNANWDSYENEMEIIFILVRKYKANINIKDKNGNNILELLLSNMSIRNRLFSISDHLSELAELGINTIPKPKQLSLAKFFIDSSQFDRAERIYFLQRRQENKILQKNCIAFFQQEDYANNLLKLLTSEDRATNKLIRMLAKHPQAKEAVLQTIRNKPHSEQQELFKEALNKGSALNTFFAVQRGWFKTSMNRGCFFKINNDLAKFNKVDKPNKLYPALSFSKA